MQKSINSFRFAGRGLQRCLNGTNFRIQIVCAGMALGASAFFGITATQWCIVVICIGVVLSLEMLNTSIEQLCDHVCSHHNPVIGLIKDVSAGAVMVSSLAAFSCACFIFIPHLILITGSTPAI